MIWLLPLVPLLLVACDTAIDSSFSEGEVSTEEFEEKPAVSNFIIDAYGNRVQGPLSGTLDAFGCKFARTHKDGPYQVSELKTGQNSAPQWGRELHFMVFQTQAEFDKFYEKLEKLRKLMLTYTVNTLTPFIRFWHSFKRSPIKSAKMFYDQFVARLYTGNQTTKADCDEICLILRVYEKLVVEYPKLKDHFVMGVADLNVNITKALINIATNASPLQTPPKNFQLEQITGVIKVKVVDKEGYVLVNPAFYSGASCVLMVGGAPCYRYKTPESGTKFGNGDLVGLNYTIVDVKNEYVHVQINNGERIRNDILYVRSSLCSFLQSAGKSSLLNPFRFMRKADENGIVLYSCRVFLFNLNTNVKQPEYLDVLSLFRWIPRGPNDLFDKEFEDLPSVGYLDVELAKDVSEHLTADKYQLILELGTFKRLSQRLKSPETPVKADDFLSFISSRK